MAHRIHAPVEEVQTPSLHGTVDHPRTDPEIEQLPPRHDPMLPLGKPGDGPVPSPTPFFTPHTEVKHGFAKALPARGACPL